MTEETRKALESIRKYVEGRQNKLDKAGLPCPTTAQEELAGVHALLQNEVHDRLGAIRLGATQADALFRQLDARDAELAGKGGVDA